MPTTPEMLSTKPNGTILGDGSHYSRHMTILANKALFFRVKRAFILREGPAGANSIKLRGTGDHAMAAITNLCGAERRIELCRMGGHGVIIRTENLPISNMTGRTGDPFLLILRIVSIIRNFKRLLHSSAWNILNERGLLIFQGRMAI